MSISLIVPVYNHWQVTAKCLISILKSDIPIKYEIIVIDDASTDATQQLIRTVIKENHPVTLITNMENKGYILSTNEALKIIDSKYILFMNNDVYLDKTCIKELLRVYETYPDVGVLGGTQYADGWKETDSALKFFTRGDKATIRDHMITSKIPDNLKNSDIVYCDDVHFACALTTKAVVDKVGLLDEEFLLGCYDQEDFCLRVKELQMQIAVCPKAKFIHYLSVSTRDKFYEYQRALDANRITFFKKWGEKLRNNQI